MSWLFACVWESKEFPECLLKCGPPQTDVVDAVGALHLPLSPGLGVFVGGEFSMLVSFVLLV